MSVQANAEERRETGLSLELIGGIVLFFDFLVLFFFPAGMKWGQARGFSVILITVAVVSFAIVVCGHVIRRRAEKEE